MFLLNQPKEAKMDMDKVIELPTIWVVIGAAVLIVANAAWVFFMKRKQHEADSLISQPNEVKE